MPRSKCKKPTTNSKLNVLDEATKKKCHSIIEDFDHEVNSKVEISRSKAEGIYSQIRTKTNLLALKLPKELQVLKFSDIVQLLKNYDENESVDEEEEVLVKPLLPPPTTTRKSRRTKKTVNKENSSSSLNETQRITRSTPAYARTVKRGVVPTPMTIKTKFNIGTPLTKNICRLAKPNEALVSMSGSPVMLGAGADIVDVVSDLNDISKDKLLTIQSRISRALEQRK
ncbi:uncharacterized protein [Lepeophtheirus salmonis]|nr:uncharacterized protein LOC121122546 [Lepeophtheirus salmonis]